jgi:hypothetical protein
MKMGLVYMLMFMHMDWEGFGAVFFARLQRALLFKDTKFHWTLLHLFYSIAVHM